MKNPVGRVLTSMSLAVLLLAGAAQGQLSPDIVKVKTPFTFIAGNKTFPAGEYSIVATADGYLTLRDSKAQVVTTIFAHPVLSDGVPSSPRLEFVIQNGGYVLRRVWLENKRTGFELARPKLRNLVAKQRPPAPGTVVVGVAGQQ